MEKKGFQEEQLHNLCDKARGVQQKHFWSYDDYGDLLHEKQLDNDTSVLHIDD